MPVNSSSSPSTAHDLLSGVSGTSSCGTQGTPPSTCAWPIAGSAIAPGRYAFGARIAASNGKHALAAVTITVEEGALPIVSIKALAVRKQNPSSRLVLIGAADLPLGEVEGDAIELAWFISPPKGIEDRSGQFIC